MKSNFKRMLPVILIILITLVMSVFLYRNVMEREEERCWQLLEDSAKNVTKEIQMKFEDNIKVLNLAATAMIQENKILPEQIPALHINEFEKNTIFSRIDIIYPDNTILLENGTKKPLRDDISFQDIAAQGEHISARMTDSETGLESVYYFMPVIKNGRIIALLTGVIDSSTLSDIFQSTLYDGQAATCIVDSEDGNYIIDNYHKELGNAFATPDRKRLKGYENVDLKSEIHNQKTGVIAFESRANGLNTYLYYMPVGIFNWELLVVAQETAVFSGLQYLKQLLVYAGIVESLLLFLYAVWNLYTVEQLSKSQKETQHQLEISHTLIQCVTELSSDTDINTAIQNLLEIITRYFNSDRTYIFEIDPEKDVFNNTYEYVTEGITPQIDNLQEVPVSLLPHWMECFEKSQPYYISSLEQEKGRESYDILKAQDIERLITVPLCKDGIVLGFVGVDNPRQFYDDATLLSSIQFFITNSLSTRKHQEQLTYMSFRDMLTALYNRNKYIQVLDSLKLQQVYTGCAYINLNGLKQINDRQGHEAGDQFIRNAARNISCIFPENSYRIGGDEFVIIVTNIEQDAFQEKIKELRKNMENEQISVSIGSVWKEKCENLEDALKEADLLMYEEKQRYYQKFDRRSHNK